MAFQIGDWVALRPGFELENPPPTTISYSITGFVVDYDGIDTYEINLVGVGLESVLASASDLRAIGTLTRARSDAFGITPEYVFPS